MAVPRGRLHMIGNAHIDPVWLWGWQEGVHETLATFRSALERLEEYDDFVFVSSSAVFYDWVRRHDPDTFERIRARVAEGRWEVVGGWWLQPDCNLPGGESFVRQALYGQRWFREHLGVMATVGYNVDSFGHHAMLPQLLRGAGLDAYVFLRPSPQELALPGRLFTWRSDDGSSVLAFRIPFEYCTWGKELSAHVGRCAAELRDPVDELMCFYGVGNHGGGPTKENIESIRRMSEVDDGGPELLFSTPNRYFAAVRERGWDLPVVQHELQRHAAGCYAAHSGVKRWNRRAEALLQTAEALSTVALRAVGAPIVEDLAHAWKGVLFNQFHDILAGTSIESAYDDARDLYGEARSIAARALNDAVQALAWQVGIPYEADTRPVLVFNPHAWDATLPVELEVGRVAPDDVLLDDEGRRVPMQLVQSEALANGRNRLVFMARLPALGYRLYRLAPGAAAPAGGPRDDAASPPLAASDTALESDRLRLEIDPETGCIVSLRDLRTGTEAFAGPAARPVVIDDPSDTWSHDVYRFDRAVGTLAPTRVSLLERGPVRATIRVESAFGGSTLVQDLSLHAGGDTVEVRATLDWREPRKALKLRFPVDVRFMATTVEVPYGVATRFADGTEGPALGWVDVSGTSRSTERLYGLSLLNDGIASYDVEVRDIGMTVTRNPIYAHHVPAEPVPGARYTTTDHGIQRFRYRLLPHERGWAEADTVRRAAELHQGPVALNATFHDGPLPPRAEFLRVEPGRVVVCALKRAEDGGATVVRVRETSGNRSPAVVDLAAWGRRIETTLGPFEIKTFLVPDDDAADVVETNLLELPA